MSVVTALMPVYFSGVVVPSYGVTISWGIIHYRFSGVSLWAYTVSATVLIVLLTAPLLGTISDIFGWRKNFFVFFSVIGGISASCLYFSYPGSVGVTLFVIVISYLGFLLSEIFYNSFLPVIAPPDKQDLISGTGYAWGYLGGAILLSAHLLVFLLYDKETAEHNYRIIRLCLASAGIWWLLFAIPSIVLLPPDRHKRKKAGRFAFSQIRSTMSEVFKSGKVILFLLAFLFYNNGIQTVITMASIYGTHLLKLKLSQLFVALLVSQLVGFPGAILFARMSERYGTRNVLMFSLIIWCCVIFYAYFVHHSREFFIMAAIVGFVIGGTQALSRSFYAKIIPSELSSQFFGFYAVGGKLSALLGPFLFGLIFDITGSIRYAILSTLAFFVTGLILLCFVSLDDKKFSESI